MKESGIKLLNNRYKFKKRKNYIKMSAESILFRDLFIESNSKKEKMVKQDCKVCKNRELNIFS